MEESVAIQKSTNEENPYKNIPQIALFVIIFFSQFFSKRKEILDAETEENKLDKDQLEVGRKLQLRYIVVFQLSKAADWCLGPFVFEFFSSYHGFAVNNIAHMIAISYLASFFLGPTLVGYLNDRKNKKISCIFYGLAISTSCLIRLFKGNSIILYISQISYGLGSAMLYSSFENWLISEAKQTIPHKNTQDYVLSGTFERSMMVDSLVAIAASIVTSNLHKMYGITAPYIFSAILCLVSISIVVLFVPRIIMQNEKAGEAESTINFSGIFTNFKDRVVEISKDSFLITIGLAESLTLSTMFIFIFCWTPRLKENNPKTDSSEIFTLFMFALAVGGAVFKTVYLFLNKEPLRVAKVIAFLCLVSFTINVSTKIYYYNLFAFLLFEIAIGMFFPTYSMIKSAYLPESTRGTIMNIFKIPLNAIVVVMLLSVETSSSVDRLLLFNMVVTFFIFIMTLFFMKPRVSENNIAVVKPKDTKKKK